MSGQLDDMYREVILDHYRSPRGKQPVDKKDIISIGHNPACGDEIELDASIENGTISHIHVDCKGCAISVASGSMLAETVKGMSLAQAEKLAEVMRTMLRGEDVVLPDDFGDLDALKGVRQFPVRVKCALLAWITLIEGMRRYHDGAASGKPISTDEESA